MNQDIGLLNDACIYGENQTSITFKDCSVIVDGEGKGLAEGVWNFINCTVRAKGGKAGSCWNLASIPSYKDCALPTGFYWKKELKYSGYSLVDADDKVVTDWVTVAEAMGDTNDSGYTGGAGKASGTDKASEKDIIAAVVCAYEVGTRISRIYSKSMLEHKIHFPGAMGFYAAAAGVAKIMKLNCKK